MWLGHLEMNIVKGYLEYYEMLVKWKDKTDNSMFAIRCSVRMYDDNMM